MAGPRARQGYQDSETLRRQELLDSHTRKQDGKAVWQSGLQIEKVKMAPAV